MEPFHFLFKENFSIDGSIKYDEKYIVVTVVTYCDPQ